MKGNAIVENFGLSNVHCEGNRGGFEVKVLRGGFRCS